MEEKKGEENEVELGVRKPLPKRLRAIRDNSFSVFISNIHQRMSLTELSAVVWRAGHLVNCFIPMDKSSGLNKGFAFARFGSEAETLKAVDLVDGRSWGGKKLSAKMADNFQRMRREKFVDPGSGFVSQSLGAAFPFQTQYPRVWEQKRVPGS